MVRRHEVLRTTFASVDGRLGPGHRPGARCAIGGRGPLVPRRRDSRTAEAERRAADEARKAVRPRERAALPRNTLPHGRRRQRHPPGDAPHHHRRLVVRRRRVRAGDALRGVPRGPTVAAARAVDPVRRLCDLAARLAPRRRQGGPPRLLAATPRGSPAARIADGSTQAARAVVAGRSAFAPTLSTPVGSERRTGSSRGYDAVHDDPGRVPGPPRPVERAGGLRRRLADREPESAGNRGPGRLLHQHAGPSRPTRPATRRSASSWAASANFGWAVTSTRICRWSCSSRPSGLSATRAGRRSSRRCSSSRTTRCRTSSPPG